MHRQGRLELMIRQFGIALLLVFREHQVGTLFAWRGGDHVRSSRRMRRHAPPLWLISELETILGTAATTPRPRQLLTFLLAQGDHFITEVLGRLPLSEEFGDPSRDRSRVRIASALLHTAFDLLQSRAQFRHRLLAVLAGHLLVRRAEHEDHAAGEVPARLVVGQFVADAPPTRSVPVAGCPGDDAVVARSTNSSPVSTSAGCPPGRTAGETRPRARRRWRDSRRPPVAADARPKTCPGRRSSSTREGEGVCATGPIVRPRRCVRSRCR